MKKIVIPFILGLITLVSCNGGGENRTGHLITGEIENADGKEAVLVVFEDQKERILDTVNIIDGKFEFETDTKELREYILLIGGGDEMPILMFLDENSEDVTISGSLPGIGENYEISGSTESQEIKDYLSFLKPFFKDEQMLYMQLQQTVPNDTSRIQLLMEKLDSISDIQREYAVERIEADPASPTSWMLLRELIPASGLYGFNQDDLSYFEKVASAMRAKYPYSEYPDLIEKDIESLQAQIDQLNNPTELTTMPGADFEYAPEIELTDPDGNKLALSSLRGQVVLIDFWASWCVPCRQENPNVVRMYNEYKDKGFTIYSVSLDEKHDAWVNAIEADQLSWPNHVSDLAGWQSSAAAAYGVNAIPATFLIDKDGKVIAKDLRGPALEQKLQEILG